MTSTRRQLALSIAIALVVAVWIIAWAARWKTTLAGDPYAVYFPIVQNLSEGHGLAGFAPLLVGVGRQPGYPILLTAASWVTGDLARAAQILGVLSAAASVLVLALSLARLGASWIAIALAAGIVAVNPVFIRSSIESLPDLVFLALYALSLWSLLPAASVDVPERERRRGALAAGLAAGAATLVRMNGVALIAGVALALLWCTRRRALVPFTIWSAGFLLALSPMLLPIFGLSRWGLTYPSGDLEAAVGGLAAGWAAVPAVVLEMVTRIPELLGRFVGWLVMPLGGAAVVTAAASRASTPTARVVLCLTACMFLPLVLIHFEARYYLFVLLASAGGFAAGLERLCERFEISDRIARAGLIASAATVAFLHVREGSASYTADLALADRLDKVCGVFEERAAGLDRPVLVGVAHEHYAYSRFRDCPRPTARPPRAILVPAQPTDLGLDLFVFFTPDVQDPGGAARLHRFDNITVLEHPAGAAAEVAGEVAGQDLEIELPGPPPAACERSDLRAEAGAWSLVLRGSAEPPLAGRATVRAGAVTRTWIFSGSRSERTIEVEVGEGDAIAVELCAADPVRSAGRVGLTAGVLGQRHTALTEEAAHRADVARVDVRRDAD